MNPTRTRILAAIGAAALALTLSACGGQSTGGNVVAPVTVDVNDLQGSTVEVAMNQALNINTGDLAVDSYTADIADPSIAEFVQGRDDGSATFNPGFTPKKIGETEITMTNEQGGIQPVEFTLVVTE